MKPVMVLLKKAESNMEEGNSKMEIKILQTEEVPKAVQLARGVFEYCLRNTINEAQLIESFYTYVREENIRQLMETQKLTIWAAYDEQNNMVAVSGMQSEGHITLLYVMPYYQRRGYGKKLLLTMREYAREKLELAQVTVNAMPAWTADYFTKRRFHPMEVTQPCSFVPMQAKTVARAIYEKKEIPGKLTERYLRKDAKEIWSGKKVTEGTEEVENHGCVLYQMKRI